MLKKKQSLKIKCILHFSYIVVWKKGYQEFQEPHGTSVIKVKGVANVTGNNTFFYTSKISYIDKISLITRNFFR
jgi:hypothetical protein